MLLTSQEVEKVKEIELPMASNKNKILVPYFVTKRLYTKFSKKSGFQKIHPLGSLYGSYFSSAVLHEIQT